MLKSRWGAALLLAAACLLTYGNGLSNPFLFDDGGTVLGNTTIRDLGQPGVVLSPPPETAVAGRPVVNLTLALNYAAGGATPFGFRLVNLVVHIACAVVLFFLLERLLTSRAPALIAAGLWAVHPINSEVVDYITQRTESLMALALLLTLWWSRPAPPPPPGRRKKSDGPAPTDLRPAHGSWALVACAVGMACKETMVLAPLLVVWCDRVFLFASWRDAWTTRGRFYAGLAATWLLLALVIANNGQTFGAGFASAHVSPWMYFLNQPGMIVRYLELMFWPGPLVSVYGWPGPQTLQTVWPALTIVSALGIVTLLLIPTRPRLGFLCASAFLLLGPTSSFLPIATEVGAERRMYLPSITVIVLVVLAAQWALRRIAPPERLAPIAASVAAVVIVALGARTVLRNNEYRSMLEMSRTVVERWPTPVAHQLYGSALATAGRHDEAVVQLRTASEGYPLARYFLGTELVTIGQIDAGMAELKRFIRDEPGLEPTYMAIGMLADILADRKAFADAIPYYEQYVAAKPRRAAAWNGLGIAYASVERPREALTAFQRAVDAEPANQQYRQNLAIVTQAGATLSRPSGR